MSFLSGYTHTHPLTSLKRVNISLNHEVNFNRVVKRFSLGGSSTTSSLLQLQVTEVVIFLVPVIFRVDYSRCTIVGYCRSRDVKYRASINLGMEFDLDVGNSTRNGFQQCYCSRSWRIGGR